MTHGNRTSPSRGTWARKSKFEKQRNQKSQFENSKVAGDGALEFQVRSDFKFLRVNELAFRIFDPRNKPDAITPPSDLIPSLPTETRIPRSPLLRLPKSRPSLPQRTGLAGNKIRGPCKKYQYVTIHPEHVRRPHPSPNRVRKSRVATFRTPTF